MGLSNGQANAVNLVIDYLAQEPGPGGVIPTALAAAGQLGALAEAANKQLMAGARFTEAAAAIAAVEQLRARVDRVRHEWAALYDDGSWTAGRDFTREEAEEIIAEATVNPRPTLVRRWASNWEEEHP